MIPWLWLWSPNVHFPWSGGVAQHIEPNTNWFFDAITPEAGIGRIEKKAFEVASYGSQLGWITEVLLELAKGEGIQSKEARKSLDKLTIVSNEIEEIKKKEFALTAQNVVDDLECLKEMNEAEYQALLSRLEAILIKAKDEQQKKAGGQS